MRSKLRAWRAESSGLTLSSLPTKGERLRERPRTVNTILSMCRSLFFSERQNGIEWRRPHELVEEPSLMEGGGDRFDINQVSEMTHIGIDSTYVFFKIFCIWIL